MNKILQYNYRNNFNTPVLFLVFNRLDCTKQVFESIRKVKPPRLYVSSDGARNNIDDEIQKVLDVRNYILQNIDWECDVKTLFRDQNMGCKYAVSNAINWFFENEEQGIILEDDCLPSQSFFWFCEELLFKYKDELKIGQISGDNFQKGKTRGDADYYFSIYNHIWGWASWSSRWKLYDVELNSINSTKFLDQLFPKNSVREYWKKIFYKTKSKQIDTWDYQWTFCLWNNQMFTILPNYNLISNIGFGKEATHTHKVNRFSSLPTFDFILKKHPSDLSINYSADRFTESIWGMKNRKLTGLKIWIFNNLINLKKNENS